MTNIFDLFQRYLCSFITLHLVPLTNARYNFIRSERALTTAFIVRQKKNLQKIDNKRSTKPEIVSPGTFFLFSSLVQPNKFIYSIFGNFKFSLILVRTRPRAAGRPWCLQRKNPIAMKFCKVLSWAPNRLIPNRQDLDMSRTCSNMVSNH